MSSWAQDYDPFGFWPLSTLISALPVVTLFFVLIVLRSRVWVASLAGFLVAVGLALWVLRMPLPMVASSGGYGVVFGFIWIAWIIIASIFLYNIAVETGQFQVMKDSIAALSTDKRLQLILIAFCFGAFLEGTGGGGAPVAIAGSFLIGLGFEPFQAATLCLLANTAPVAWGGVGNPIRVLAGVTGLSQPMLSAMVGRILPPVSAILPFWLVRSMVGWRQTAEVWPALLVSGLSFATIQFYWSNYQDASLVDVVAALGSLLVMVGFLKLWRPREIIPVSEQAGETTRHSMMGVLKGWSPFLIASVLIFIWTIPSVKSVLSSDALRQPVPYLHKAVTRMPPVVPEPTVEDAVADLNLPATPGTAVFLGGVVAALLLGMSPARIARTLVRTFAHLVPSLLAISFMVGLAFVTRYSGMDTILGLSLTRTGPAFPFFGTLLGWLGVALTGTDAGSNALFGNLQKVTAERLGLDPVLMASANSSGGVMGKMIDAQSIVVSSTATDQVGNEAAIFKYVFKHSLALAILVAIIVTCYAFLFPGIIPGATASGAVVQSVDPPRTVVRRTESIEQLGGTVYQRDGRVVEVNLDRSGINDHLLSLVMDFHHLTDLSLEETSISDAGLMHLDGLTELRWLNLYRTKIGDAGLARVGRLARLEQLPIGETKVTDAGLAHLAPLRRLTYLGLRGNAITDAGVVHLKGLKSLTGLHLGQTGITDHGVSELVAMETLQNLWLHDTAITDRAVPELGKLKGLKKLYIYRTGLSIEGVKTLGRSLPDCQIYYRSDREPESHAADERPGREGP
jgi:lactate permease